MSRGRLMLKNRKCVTYELNFKLGSRLKHALSTAMASYKGLVNVGRAYRVSRTRDGHTTCWHWRPWYTQTVLQQVHRAKAGHIVSTIVKDRYSCCRRVSCCLSIQLHQRATAVATTSCSALKAAITGAPRDAAADYNDAVSDADSGRTEDARRRHRARGSSAAATCSSSLSVDHAVTTGIQRQISAADPVDVRRQSAVSSSQAALSDVPEATAAVKSIF